MYSLYYSPFACSFAVHAALEKIGEPYELTKVDIYKQEHLTPEFEHLNPNRQVPVLQHDQVTITQASAILLYLSERHPNAHLMPPISHRDRADALQVLFYLSNTLHPLFLRLFYPNRISEQSPDDVKRLGTAALEEAFRLIDRQLSKTQYCVSDTLYAPDYYLLAMLNWLRIHPVDISDMEHIQTYLKRMREHPEVQVVMAKEMQSMAA